MASANLVSRWFSEALKPEPILQVSDWADKSRILSRKAASEPGPWRTDRTPYLRRIMNVLSVTNPAKKVVFKKASQIGGTEAGNNWLGYIIDHAPGPTMLVLPTVDIAKRNSHLRIEPLIDDSPSLKKKLAPTRSRDTTNTALQKDFDGGTLVITGANSASGLKSMPCRFVMGDEIDEWPRNVEGQGSGISLLAARSRTFSRRKMFLVSTPTFEGSSAIEEEFEDSTQEHYYVQCPHCKHAQTLVMDNLQWDEGKPNTALYYCIGCGVGIEERYKTQMLKDKESGGTAEWIAHNPGHETIGFFLNSLYSPIGWLSWKEIATIYDQAKRKLELEKNDEEMIAFRNTIEGLAYKHSGESPEWQKIYDRREKYEIGVVPVGVIFLTMGVDVQANRLEAEVVGWGVGKESWSIEYKVFEGDTTKPEVWAELEKYMGSTFPQAGFEYRLPIKMVAVDSGFNTQHVYNFCRKFPLNRVAAIKGQEKLQMGVSLPKALDVKVNNGKRPKRRGMRVWGIGVNLFKTELYGWLKLDLLEDGTAPKGYCHFPEYDPEYFKQLTAEKVVVSRDKKGFTKLEFQKERERNEALDVRVYARAAASMVGLDRLRDLDQERFRAQPIANTATPAQTKAESQPTVKKPDRQKRPRKVRDKTESIWAGMV